ncbi:RelA/SpoT family protein [Marinithermus hydrothermalis]|uniref:(P)ppGpp synthetase I, SpoT/RelA n=1 Tax=Marinithermus hydrothermalis (strain DSM 14884 / JCM 11576 / T1) TaxID=869210 RepID=F2NMZ2_MARHT|nr:bifunctional (p)ppGpp synthetase/guanosine-3',5'-bis(diphosphate) 3'-pyrophosphohydrolase [Marinithermus hydrothermalis]AEB12731.1 (p)ppGpp synthetase I, SpoT/RelA [Marinithermus hydrothermalis DSM 14884]
MMTSLVTPHTLWKHLEPKLGYLTPQQRNRVQEALEFAFTAHDGQHRKSGDPFITHPVAVAGILAELKMDEDTLIAGLLHDTVEDTDVTLDAIEARFGPTVRRIVEGETKVSKLPKIAESIEDEQAENLRQMFIAMTEDVRIIIVKLADRLHNMRTLEFMPPEKQQRISRETLEIFAPLAHRLGIGQIKWELEDLAFRYLHPEECAALEVRLSHHRAEHQAIVERAKAALEEALAKDYVLKLAVQEYTVTGRTKHLYSIWKKMERDGKTLEQIYDLLALRVILDPRPSSDPEEAKAREKQVCYHVIGLVHALWQPIPGRVKDYIAMPKPNGYQSLHTTVITWQGMPLEVQIRTREMHRIAEYGIAAHWLYKEGLTNPEEVKRRVSWLRAIQEWQQEFSSSREFVEAVTKDLLGGRVFVFTPKGQIINLPKGATPVDFAYHIHTEVGHSMIGAKVNGRIVPLSYELQNADIVEIITSKASTGPSKDWLNYAKTRSARSKIRHFFREQERGETLVKGQRALEKYLKRRGLPLPKEAELEAIAQKLLGHASPEDLYLAIVQGRVTTAQVARLLVPEEERTPRIAPPPDKKQPLNLGVYLEGDLKAPIKMASCCRPVRDDAILGYVTRGRGVTVHRTDCPNMKRLLREQPERCLAARWDSSTNGTYLVQLHIEADDRAGLLRDVLNVFALMGKSVLSADTQVSGTTASMQLRFEVKDAQELARIKEGIRKIPEIRRITRM